MTKDEAQRSIRTFYEAVEEALMDDRHMAEIIRLLERELENRALPIVSRLADESAIPLRS